MKVLFLMSLFCIFSFSVFAQITREDLAKKYGDQESNFVERATFQIRPDVLMTASYADDGKISEMWIEPKTFNNGIIDKKKIIPLETAEEIFREIVPENLITEKPETFLVLLGRHRIKYDVYQNLTVTRHIIYYSNNLQGVSRLLIELKANKLHTANKNPEQ